MSIGKTVFRHPMRVLVTLILLATPLLSPCCGGQDSKGKVVTYPAPEGEILCHDYKVFVSEEKIHIYTARVLDPPFAGNYDHGGNYCFTSFDMAGQVAVRIESQRSLRNVVIRPLSYGIKHKLIDQNTITFPLDMPRKISIEPDGKKAPLLLFANPIETDAPGSSDENVIFFGPGLHKPEKIEVKSN